MTLYPVWVMMNRLWRLISSQNILWLSMVTSVQTATLSAANERSHDETLLESMARGRQWLLTHQHPDGWWSTQDHPAVTAFALMALEGASHDAKDASLSEAMQRGYEFIEQHIHPDGGIHNIGLVTYNTAICMMALAVSGQDQYQASIVKAREYLIGLQSDFGQTGVLDHPMDGGIGYGSSYDHSDMGNTLQALEALHATRMLGSQDQGKKPEAALDYAAAIRFLQHCQNLASHNPEKWVSEDPVNKGGFVYYPGSSKAGEYPVPGTERVALRSYGSISYGGLLAYAYAQLDKQAPQVQAVIQWLRSNYTLEENPAMGLQGLFYYYHTMAKALTILEMDQLQLSNGQIVNWRKELTQKLTSIQKEDGSWLNDNGRWWERDPALVTSYAVLTLERIKTGQSSR